MSNKNNPYQCAYEYCKNREIKPNMLVGCVTVNSKTYHEECYEKRTERKYKAIYDKKGKLLR